MRINDAAHVCEHFLPGETHPINKDFELCGITTHICTITYMRGHFGLKEGELPGDYEIAGINEWLYFSFYCSPKRNQYTKTFRKERRKHIPDDAQEIIKAIEEECLRAIVAEE